MRPPIPHPDFPPPSPPTPPDSPRPWLPCLRSRDSPSILCVSELGALTFRTWRGSPARPGAARSLCARVSKPGLLRLIESANAGNARDRRSRDDSRGVPAIPSFSPALRGSANTSVDLCPSTSRTCPHLSRPRPSPRPRPSSSCHPWAAGGAPEPPGRQAPGVSAFVQINME